MNLAHYMLKTYLNISMEVIYTIHADYLQQTYLCDNCDVQMPLLENYTKRTGFACVTIPKHLMDELPEIEFKGEIVIIEKTKSPTKS